MLYTQYITSNIHQKSLKSLGLQHPLGLTSLHHGGRRLALRPLAAPGGVAAQRLAEALWPRAAAEFLLALAAALALDAWAGGNFSGW